MFLFYASRTILFYWVRKVYCLFISFFFLFSVATLNGQGRDLKFDHYNTTNGLSQNTVHSIVQDNKGFLWIGTEDGLNRFDGYKFTCFKKEVKDPFSLSDNFANCLYVDKRGDLWIGTNSKGINVYNDSLGLFSACLTYRHDGKDTPIRFVSAIVEDNDQNIWFSCLGGLFKYSRDSAKVVDHLYNTSSSNSLSDNQIRFLCHDNGVIWIGTEAGGLNRLDIKSRQITRFMADGSPKSITNNGVSSVLRDKKGRLWVGTNNGLNLLDENTGTFVHFQNNPFSPKSLSENIIYGLLEDRYSNLWIGTPNGLLLFDRDKGEFYTWKHNPLSPLTSLSENVIYSMFEDRYGQIWLGTPTSGLNKFNPGYKAFSHFFHDELNPNSLSNNVVRELYEDSRERLWISTFDFGLDLYDPKTGRFEFFSNNPSDNQSLALNKVTSVFEDSKGRIWVATHGGGLDCALFKDNRYSFVHYKNNPNDTTSISNNSILEVIEDPWGRLWLGSRSGIDLFNPDTGKAIRYANNPNSSNSLVPNTVQSGCILFDTLCNTMWVGTWSGLSKIILSADTHLPERFINYTQNDTSQFALTDSRVISLYKDKKGHLWVGTCGGGLNKLSLNSEGNVVSVKGYTESDGLSNNVVYAILEDDNQNLWLSTNLGLSKFNPNSNFFINYDKNDGLQGNQFYWGAACKLKSGNFAFGGVNGFNIFSPNAIKPDTIMPDIVITDFKISNEHVPIGSNSPLHQNINSTKTIQLPYSKNSIAFEFSALHTLNSNKNQYAYMLGGFDDAWVNTNATNRTAVYTNLDPGTYFFKVKGSNADGIWNERGVEIEIVIESPFWSTWWFRSLIICFVLLLLVLLYYYRTASLRKRQRILEKLVEEKTREVTAQKEAVQAANEELVVSNEELFQQRQELEATLMSLSETQNKMFQLDKMASIGVLAAGVAHEINNPLNFINGGIMALEGYIKDNLPEHLQEMTPMIDGIHTGVERAAVIVASLGHYSHRNEQRFFEYDLHAIIDHCLVILQTKYRGQIDVVKKYTSNACVLICNEGKLHQAFLNILANAIQAIQSTGSISIATFVKQSNEGKFVEVVIEDTGCGISPENLSKIMDPFFTTKAPGQGTGLGLSITYNIIKEHNGSIEFFSRLGEGTRVVVRLPFEQIEG